MPSWLIISIADALGVALGEPVRRVRVERFSAQFLGIPALLTVGVGVARFVSGNTLDVENGAGLEQRAESVLASRPALSIGGHIHVQNPGHQHIHTLAGLKGY